MYYMMHDTTLAELNDLSREINALYGYVNVAGDNFGEPAINSGPCAPFAKVFYECWNKRFTNKVNIVFVMVKNTDECWHVLIRLPNDMLFDGGFGIHSDDKYSDKLQIMDMKLYDEDTLEKYAYGLDRKYPRYCPNFSIDAVKNIIDKHLAKI